MNIQNLYSQVMKQLIKWLALSEASEACTDKCRDGLIWIWGECTDKCRDGLTWIDMDMEQKASQKLGLRHKLFSVWGPSKFMKSTPDLTQGLF